jgi:G3E family GTPase
LDDIEAIGLRLVANHIYQVQSQMRKAKANLSLRATMHDASKYSEEELPLVLGKAALDKEEYMSDKERKLVANVSEAIQHHYEHNDHHPEHHENGIHGMSLFMLLEMMCDWKVASDASPNGDIWKSLELNRVRFGISPELMSVLEMTAREMGW